VEKEVDVVIIVNMQEENIRNIENLGTEENKWRRERILFQLFLIKKIIGEKPSHKTDEEWEEERHSLSSKLASEYGKKFSDIIDNDNDMKKTIMSGDYESIAEQIIEKLHIKISV
jgi:hypothetical protein